VGLGNAVLIQYSTVQYNAVCGEGKYVVFGGKVRWLCLDMSDESMTILRWDDGRLMDRRGIG
jgi:hypothetical protein